MSDEDDSSRTEEPTAKRLEEARERGEVPHSQELQTWAGLTGAALALAMLIPAGADRLVRACLPFIERPESLQVGLDDMRSGLGGVLLELGSVLAPTLLLLAGFGVACGLGQSGLLWSPKRVAPDISKLSPMKGLSRLFSVRAAVEFVKNLVKLSALSAAFAMLLMPVWSGIDQWASLPVMGVLGESDHVIRRMVATAAVLMTLVAGADYIWQRFSFLKRMRMTRQELRDEYRQADGDPQIKARIRRLRQERSKKRMMAAVPTATVVITNPTHYAVALAWDPAAMPAPKVVAKGMDKLALRIRRVAEESDVPVLENPPLARSLHAAVAIDEEIPAEHYEAVAQVIGWVMRGRAGHPTP